MPRASKYTPDTLGKAVEHATSMLSLLRSLGLKPSGGSHTHLRRLIKKWNLDISHFKTAVCAPVERRGGARPLKPEDILVEGRHDRRENVVLLRRSLLAIGVEERCSSCPLVTTWNGNYLRLQIDHINGNPFDNRPQNLRFLCPNCHSQTASFGFRGNGFPRKPARKHPCSVCSKPVKMSSKMCRECTGSKRRAARQCKKCRCSLGYSTRRTLCDECFSSHYKTKTSWPTTDELKKMVEETPLLHVAKGLGVSDNAVRKRLRKQAVVIRKHKPKSEWNMKPKAG